MARLISVPEPRPIFDLNTTPLIDVMLVLLIMFIITIPIQTHAVKIDVPTCSKCPKPNGVKNEVAITREGAILWNGENVGEDGLRYELAMPGGCGAPGRAYASRNHDDVQPNGARPRRMKSGRGSLSWKRTR